MLGLSDQRVGAEMFIDEFKIFGSALTEDQMLENQGGDQIPFGPNQIILACEDCTFSQVDFGFSRRWWAVLRAIIYVILRKCSRGVIIQP